MNFKKRVNGSWADTPHYIHNTSTDTITTPADIYANDTTATVGLKGNMSQSSTPTPTDPIQPSECGERTANLFSYSFAGRVTTTGEIIADSYYRIFVAEVVKGEKYTISNQQLTWTVSYYTTKPDIGSISYNSSRSDYQTTEATITVPDNDNIKYIAVRYNANLNGMINSGSTALPYEPYGQYKIPILSNSTTTPVYLGEVQSSRRIKKLVLTGQENITSGHLDVSLFNVPVSDYLKENINSIVSTHYTSQNNVTVWNYVNDKRVCFYAGAGTNTILYIRDSTFSTVEDFKAYLAQQYAAGTPVCVWYVLATEETGIVNEPLRKIGDYADTVSGITIPTIAGANTFSVDTTLQPSEVSVNYKGWHPVQSVHEMHTHLDASLFELGTITGYGQKDELTSRIRTKTFIDLSNTKSINTLSSAKVFLIAWTEEATTIGYYYCVGGWNGSSFGNQTGLWLSEIDVESIVETYPTYKFAVILRYDDNREVTDFDDLLSLVDFYPKTW